MKIGIVIATYYRPDGKTDFYLRRALSSIEKQSFKDFKVYVIGDDYTNQHEWPLFAKDYNQVAFVNLPIALERSLYPFGDYRLYCSGGANAVNTGISLALADGIEYICHLDHDDWWEDDHLETIHSMITSRHPMFCCTIATYMGSYLPVSNFANEIIPYPPKDQGCSLSSSCIHYSKTSLRLRDVFAEVGIAHPGDGDFWTRLSDEMIEKEECGFLTTKITVHHDEEGYSYLGQF